MDSLVKVNVGSGPNDGTGDPLRDAFIKVNKNVDTVVAAIGAPSGIAALGTDGRLPPGQAPAVQTLPTTAHDLNTYQMPGSYRQASTAGAQAGTNYPQATGGLLEVVGTGASGQALQRYTVASTGSVSPTSGTRQYWRFSINTSWSPWQEVHTAGNALPYLGRVEAGADLNNYANRGMWAIAASSTAAGGTNFPVGNSGWLLVYAEAAAGAAAGTNVNQVYIGSNTNRQFFRSLVGGAWSAWEEVVRSSLLGAASGVGSLDTNGRQPVGQAPYSAILPAGTDANTLATPGVWHINSDAQATAALNWPVLLAGTLNVEAVVAGNMQVTQVYTTRNGTGGVIRRFVRVRFGASGGTWGSWQEIAVLDAATGRLPSTRLPAVTESLWNGTTLTLGAGGRWIQGNFDGLHAADTASVQTLRAGTPTYFPIVPGAGSDSSYVICRNAATPSSAFVALGMNGSVLMADLTFSRHGTAGVPNALRIFSATTECGRIVYDGAWILGPYMWVPNANARQHVYYGGGGSQYGSIYRGQAQADGTAIQFQAYNGSVAGYIYSKFDLSVVYATTSDYRLKNLVAELDPEESLEIVRQYRPIAFRMKISPVDSFPQEGFFAHELQALTPQAVTGQKDGMKKNQAGEDVPDYQGVDASKTIPRLVSAIHALISRVESLQQEVAELRAAAGTPE